MKQLKTILICLIFISRSLFAQNGALDSAEILNVVNEWTNALNNRDIDKLDKLYASELLFYCKEEKKEYCLNLKRKALKATPDFNQKIVSNVEITLYENGTVKCDFTKAISSKGKTKNYPAYLLLSPFNTTYLIIGESDKITDGNLNYNLSLGNPVTVSSSSNSSFFNLKVFVLIGGSIIILVLLIVLLKRKKNRNYTAENDTSNINYSMEEVPVNMEESIISTSTSGNNLKNKSAETAETAKKVFTSTLTQTKTFITKVFDLADSIDRKLYGKRMMLFFWFSIIVLIIAPLADEIFSISNDKMTYFSTLFFFLFMLILIISFIGSWRDDSGNWSWKRAKSRLATYYATLKDTYDTTRTTSLDENLYKLGQILFFAGFGWKALQNLSVFIRKPIETILHSKLESLRQFEKVTNHSYWALIVLGLGILFFLYKKNPKILQRITIELKQLFGFKPNSDQKYSTKIATIESPTSELVINAKTHLLKSSSVTINSNVFSDFAIAIQNWTPANAYYEYEFQDKLYRHLRKHLPEASIELEYPIGSSVLGNKGRADIVINDTILIEMKGPASVNAGAIQRTKGQILQYSETWKGKGPVILLLCDYNYDHAKLAFESTMSDLAKLNRPVLTIVAKPK